MIDMEKVQEPKCFVYGLVDPDTRLVFYVGQTTVGMSRPNDHHRSKGWSFEVAILEAVSDNRAAIASLCPWLRDDRNPTALNELERYWIALGRAMGWPLRNKTDGGDGMRPTPEIRARMSASQRGKKHPAEVIEKIREAIRRRMQDPTANLGNAGRSRKPKIPKIRRPRPKMSAEDARRRANQRRAERRAMRRGLAPRVPRVPFAPATHCKHGHRWTKANTYRRPDGGRTCRRCNAACCARLEARGKNR